MDLPSLSSGKKVGGTYSLGSGREILTDLYVSHTTVDGNMFDIFT
jgi:hypothetical protein